MTTQSQIRDWFQEGVHLGASHLVVVCDTFDHEDYPVYVKLLPANEVLPANEDVPAGYHHVHRVHDVRKYVQENYSGQNMQRTMEVYKLSDPLDEQVMMGRCVRY